MHKTLFNPLAKSRNPSDSNHEPIFYMEDLVTSPGVTINPHIDLEKAIKLFWFKDIFDAAQAGYIDNGFERFAKQLPETTGHSFTLEVTTCHPPAELDKPYDFTQENAQKTLTELHCIGTQKNVLKIEDVMRTLYEKKTDNVDTSYYFPNLGHNEDNDFYTHIGWQEARTGTFVFTDEDIFKTMRTLFNLPQTAKSDTQHANDLTV